MRRRRYPSTVLHRAEKADVGSRRRWMLSAGGLALTLLTAILTGAVSYVYGVANDIRKGRLDFVNTQIEKLYGPLYAASQANDGIWKLFMKHQWRNQDAQDESPFFDDSNPPSVDQVRRWRHWMRTVFQPLNLKMEEAIVANSHLLVGDGAPPSARHQPTGVDRRLPSDGMPLVFRNLIAHTEAYKAVIAAWGDDDFAECQQPARRLAVDPPCPAVTLLRNTAGINYPGDVVQCVAEDYAKLKRRQQELQSSFAFFAPSVVLVRSPACGPLTE